MPARLGVEAGDPGAEAGSRHFWIFVAAALSLNGSAPVMCCCWTQLEEEFMVLLKGLRFKQALRCAETSGCMCCPIVSLQHAITEPAL